MLNVATKTTDKSGNKFINKSNNKSDNKSNILNDYKSRYNDILNNDTEKMHILPPHCPLTPKTYQSFFNDRPELNSVSPYKIVYVKHPKDGKVYRKLEYNNFYSNWKQDALKWYPDNQYMDTEPENMNNKINIETDPRIQLYEQTRIHHQFAVPLATNGTNQLNILFNDKCSHDTFNYKRYASQNINNTKWFANKLYDTDISQDTQDLKSQYYKNIVQDNMNLYSSVFEDMYILGRDFNQET
jgi:hypothetical protein